MMTFKHMIRADETEESFLTQACSCAEKLMSQRDQREEVEKSFSESREDEYKLRKEPETDSDRRKGIFFSICFLNQQ